MGAEVEKVGYRVELNIGDRTLQGNLAIPAAPVTARELLPILRSFDDSVVGVAWESSERRGVPISCRAGCGACCRQLVPVSLPEARALAKLVDEMPKDRQAAVRRRFSEVLERLRTGGLLERLRASSEVKDTSGNGWGSGDNEDAVERPSSDESPSGTPTANMPTQAWTCHPDESSEADTQNGGAGASTIQSNPNDTEEKGRLARDYFALGIPCPFLEEESCSIHPDRPLTCREYLVTNPAERCSAPEKGGIDKVTLPIKLSTLLYGLPDVVDSPDASPPRWVPLALALEWVSGRSADGEVTYDAPKLLERFLKRIAEATTNGNEDTRGRP